MVIGESERQVILCIPQEALWHMLEQMGTHTHRVGSISKISSLYLPPLSWERQECWLWIAVRHLHKNFTLNTKLKT